MLFPNRFYLSSYDIRIDLTVVLIQRQKATVRPRDSAERAAEARRVGGLQPVLTKLCLASCVWSLEQPNCQNRSQVPHDGHTPVRRVFYDRVGGVFFIYGNETTWNTDSKEAGMIQSKDTQKTLHTLPI